MLVPVLWIELITYVKYIYCDVFAAIVTGDLRINYKIYIWTKNKGSTHWSGPSTDNPLYTDMRYNDKIRYNDKLIVKKPSLKR